MVSIWSDVWRSIFSTFSGWIVLTTGVFAFGTGIYFSYKAAIGEAVPPNGPFAAIWYLSFVALVLASGRTVYVAHRRAILAEQSPKHDPKAQREQTWALLVHFFEAGSDLLRETITTHGELTAWKQQAQRFREGCQETLRGRLTEDEWFDLTAGRVNKVTIRPRLNEEHEHEWQRLNSEVMLLADLSENYAMKAPVAIDQNAR